MKTRYTVREETFTVGEKTYTAELRANHWGERAKKGRAHVWGAGDDRCPSKEFQALADHLGAPSVYTTKGEYPALDKAFRKMNKEIVAAKREVFDAAVAALELTATSVKFSRWAGCSSCPCSPGFVFDGAWNQTVFVNEVKDNG